MELKIRPLMKRHSWLMFSSLGLGKRPVDPEPRPVKGRCCLAHVSDSKMGHTDISKLFKIIWHWDTITFGKKSHFSFLFMLLFASLILQINYKIPAGNEYCLMFLLVCSFYSYIYIFDQLHVYTFNKINIQLNSVRWNKMMS